MIDTQALAVIMTIDGKERQIITCNVCEYTNNVSMCNFCNQSHNFNLPRRIYVPEIIITRMNNRIKKLFGGPIYAHG